jgi:hypothetical protein
MNNLLENPLIKITYSINTKSITSNNKNNYNISNSDLILLISILKFDSVYENKLQIFLEGCQQLGYKSLKILIADTLNIHNNIDEKICEFQGKYWKKKFKPLLDTYFPSKYDITFWSEISSLPELDNEKDKIKEDYNNNNILKLAINKDFESWTKRKNIQNKNSINEKEYFIEEIGVLNIYVSKLLENNINCHWVYPFGSLGKVLTYWNNTISNKILYLKTCFKDKHHEKMK